MAAKAEAAWVSTTHDSRARDVDGMVAQLVADYVNEAVSRLDYFSANACDP